MVLLRHLLLFASIATMTLLGETPRVLGQPAGADATVILRDSFEKGQAAPADWQQGGDVPGVQYEWSDGVASDGKRSLSLEKTENRFFPIAQWSRTVPLKGQGGNVEVSVKVKAAGAQKAIVDVTFLSVRGTPMSHKWLAYIGAEEEGDPAANHDWGTYSRVLALPRGAKGLGIGLQIYGPGEVWFDELTVRHVGAPGEAAAVDTGSDSAAKPQAASEETAADGGAVAGAIEVKVNDNATGQYLLVPPAAEPAGLLIVLPGGDGSAEFHPFVANIATNALGGKFAVAQPIAVKWRPDQQITWPTLQNKTPGMKFSTEELVGKVMKDVIAKHKIDRQRIFVLAWSSGGPAAYAIALHKQSPVTGSLIAMSVFKQKELPALANAAKRSFYLLHSPDDQVCPYWMAQQATTSLEGGGARTTLVDYSGGHGWQGDVFGNIRAGVAWLEEGE
jgi:predicted esterase